MSKQRHSNAVNLACSGNTEYLNAIGGRSGKAPPFKKRNGQAKPDLGKSPLGELLTTIGEEDCSASLRDLPSDAGITACKYIASYSWLNEKEPTIIVPGKPPLWTPLQAPKRLSVDTGQYFRDPNAARFPRYPIEPAVQAIFESHQAFPTEDIDVFACGSTMGHLLRFVRAVDKPFRFSVQVIGNTVFFVRKENDPREIIPDIRGYSHTFPDEYTTWEADVKGSDTHQRLIQYEFGGSKCLMRFECEGYIDKLAAKDKAKSNSVAPGDNDIFQSFKATSVSQKASNVQDSLVIKTSGSEIPQSSIFDLKTRSHQYKASVDMTDFYPVLWLEQIPNFIIAYHDGAGLFHDIRVQDIRHSVREWETDNEAARRRLAVLLRRIVEAVRADPRGLLEVYSPCKDRLEIRKQVGDGVETLPPVLKARWEEGTTFAVSGDEEPCAMSAEETRSGLEEPDSEDDDGEKDFTACSAETCGYCGRCSY
ncbi:hypothetical protein BDV95DRAFT_630395 [Massariosphaeria phaeospora]|uniref:Geranylgeranyl pyrophosphate synthetase n=1 Tax=Massariosphaeria phaeospora TaxID=100035 RepID=A0A7C8M331_9PLEO|nr:hypothetical protein BDV95DRAFT_630395 [Massariosphaeria phaeospora]